MSSRTKATAKTEEAKPALVPKLRFPEFGGLTGWKANDLVEVADFVNEKVNVAKVSPEAYVSTECILPDYAGIAGASKLPATGSVTRFKPDDTLVSNIRPYLKKVWVADKEGGASNDVIVIRAKRALLPEYLACLLKNDAFIDYVMTGAKGVKMPRGDIGSMKEYPTLFPSPAEQQKIAECLSTVDALMAAQARKVDALKTHKKGLMQHLFPREGETQPRLRLPEFQNAGEWSEGSLADIGTVLQGYGFPERHQGLKNGDYPFYKVSDISKTLAAGKVFIKESANYINESLLTELRAKPIPEGTTIFAKIGEAIRSNKRAITTVPCLIDNNAAGVKRIKGKATDLFIYMLMEQISLIDHAGGVVPAVNKSAIQEIAVKFPKPDEQERIASCLSSLDALINAETQKLEAFKAHKKGLMQQLFPSPEDAAA
jgi:type I restriction enzyme S subunit